MNSAIPPAYLKSCCLALAGLGVGGALVGERDLQALVEEGEFAQALGQRVVVELGDGEDGAVGQEVDLGAELFRRLHAAQLADGRALGVVLLPCEAVAPDFDVQLLTERVDAAYAHAVQSAGDLVVGGVELAAGVQLGEHHLDGGHLLAVGDHVVHRDAAAVVHHGDGVVDVDGDVDARGVSGQRLVHRVVDYLVDQVVQAQLAGRTDVHGGTQADGCEAFEYGDIFRGVPAAVPVFGCGRRGRGGGFCVLIEREQFRLRADYGRCHSHSMRRWRCRENQGPETRAGSRPEDFTKGAPNQCFQRFLSLLIPS